MTVVATVGVLDTVAVTVTVIVGVLDTVAVGDAVAVAVGDAITATGDVRLAEIVPSPSWPDQFCPQQYAVPPDTRPQV